MEKGEKGDGGRAGVLGSGRHDGQVRGRVLGLFWSNAMLVFRGKMMKCMGWRM